MGTSETGHNSGLGRFIDRILASDIAPPSQRSALRIEDERQALRRLLSFDPDAAATARHDIQHGLLSPELAQLATEREKQVLQDKAILNSILRRVLTQQRRDGWMMNTNLKLGPAAEGGEAKAQLQDPVIMSEVDGSIKDDGRKLPAQDVIRMVEEGYPYAAYDSWRSMHAANSSSTLARCVLLSSEHPSSRLTRQVVDGCLRETIGEMLADAKVATMIKKACIKKLKHRLAFTQQKQRQEETKQNVADTDARTSTASSVR